MWRRYLEGGGTQNQNYVTYIITREGERWGIRARFGAGRPVADAKVATRNSAAALKGLDVFIQAVNSHNPEALAAAIHYPHVRIADGELQYWATSKEFLAGTEPGRQRTWAATRIESANVEQIADRGANIAVTYSRRSHDGEIVSKYEAVYLITQRDDGWKVQGCSSMGP